MRLVTDIIADILSLYTYTSVLITVDIIAVNCIFLCGNWTRPSNNTGVWMST